MNIKITSSDKYLFQYNKLFLTKHGIKNDELNISLDELQNQNFLTSLIYQNWVMNLYYKLSEQFLLSLEDLDLIEKTNKMVNYILKKELWKNNLELSRARKLLNSLKKYSDLYSGKNLDLKYRLEQNKKIISYIRDGDFKSNIEQLSINYISLQDHRFFFINDFIELSLDHFDLWLGEEHLLLFKQNLGIGELSEHGVLNIDLSHIDIVDMWLKKTFK